MSAGTGIRHAEFNLEPETTRLFQIWIMPDGRGGKAQAPSWGAKPFPKGERAGRFVTLASGFAEDTDALPIRTDARVVGASLKAGESVEYPLGSTRHGYLVPSKGRVEVNGIALNTRDGAAAYGEDVLRVTALEDAEVVLVDAA
jgi:redox-sensitive bicupin YhaK (pirin superfamily)